MSSALSMATPLPADIARHARMVAVIAKSISSPSGLRICRVQSTCRLARTWRPACVRASRLRNGVVGRHSRVEQAGRNWTWCVDEEGRRISDGRGQDTPAEFYVIS